MRAQQTDRFAPARRHLTILVGVLVLLFALTAALAANAYRADAARRVQAAAALQDVVERGAADWTAYVQQLTVATLEASYRGAIRRLARERDAELDELAAEARPDRYCPACATEVGEVTHFSADVRGGGMAQRGPVRLSRDELTHIIERATGFRPALVHDSVGTQLLVLGGDGPLRVVATFVRLDEAGRPLRVTGYTLPPAVLRESLQLVFDSAWLLPPGTAVGARNGDLLSARATVGDVVLVPGAADRTAVRAERRLAAAPLAGLTLEVGLRRGAADRLLLGGAVSSRLPLFAALMAAITLLLFLALLLVRREAELVRLRADFISAVSHELRTPLAQIRMFTETLLLGRVRSDVERRRSLEIIDQEARRLTRLVENVLTFSKTEGGRTTSLVQEPAMLAVEVRSAVEAFAPLCRSRSVDVRLELQEDITAPVDRGALRQILSNLLENALKYGPNGQRITVGAALYDDTARVWVDDEGPGIPVAERERVFDAFYRVEQESQARRSGSGIGLSVVRELARLHGGSVRAEAAPGGGARLSVELPGARRIAADEKGLAAAS